ncbi:MAG: OB-fold nucleic acid binding domain-containing protein [Propionibacteriaceae bacterium]|nr:OB-fold nucleic acid binding domain-containing protein [Propionibacteriaceae bacterium]
MAKKNIIQRLRTRFSPTAADSDVEVEALEDSSFTKIGDIETRGEVSVQGVVTSLELKECEGAPWLEAEVFDETDVLNLVWMGRQAVPGVKLGRILTLKGRVNISGGVKRMYNPNYELGGIRQSVE